MDELDLWTLVLESNTIDVASLFAAVNNECQKPGHDFRTRMLVHESLQALSSRSNRIDTLSRLSPSARPTAEAMLDFEPGAIGFPTLPRRLMDHTAPEKILEFFRELSTGCRSPVRIDVGGSAALILRGLLERRTDDIDAVDEVPSILRSNYALLERLTTSYNLHIAHFQSHYLPDRWKNRVHSLDVFGQLTVFLVDPVDIFVGKLFSTRMKDLDDLRMLKRKLDWPTIVGRLESSSNSLRSIETALEAAMHNWYVLTGDPLPPAV